MTREEETLIYMAVDGALDEQGFAEFEKLLATSDEALSLYCRQAQVQSDIEWFYNMARNVPKAAARKARLVEQAKHRQQKKILAFSLGIAAVLLLSVIPVLSFINAKNRYTAKFIATGSASWSIQRSEAGQSAGTDELRNGDRFTLHKGSVELLFRKDIRAIMQAPVDLTFKDDSRIAMNGGRGYFEITGRQGKNFTVELAEFDVVDLGTRFAIDARKGQPHEVHVFQGEVELRKAGKILRSLRASEAVEKLPLPGKFRNIPLDHSPFPKVLGENLPSLRIDFDMIQPDGSLVVAGNEPEARAKVVPVGKGNVTTFDTPVGTAARFDGSGSHVLVENWRGISGTEPRTVVFHCRIPAPPHQNAPFAIVSWGHERTLERRWQIVMDSSGRGAHGVMRVATGPNQAACGLRYLADGHWHHLAIVFDPAAGNTLRDGVSIYVDGRREFFSFSTQTKVDTAPADSLIIGAGLNYKIDRASSLVGDLANVSIHRAVLTPEQISQLHSQSGIGSLKQSN